MTCAKYIGKYDSESLRIRCGLQTFSSSEVISLINFIQIMSLPYDYKLFICRYRTAEVHLPWTLPMVQQRTNGQTTWPTREGSIWDRRKGMAPSPTSMVAYSM